MILSRRGLGCLLRPQHLGHPLFPDPVPRVRRPARRPLAQLIHRHRVPHGRRPHVHFQSGCRPGVRVDELRLPERLEGPAASYRVSATTSTLWLVPSRSRNVTVQAWTGTARKCSKLALLFAMNQHGQGGGRYSVLRYFATGRPPAPAPPARPSAWSGGDHKLIVYLTNLSTTRLKTASGIRSVR